MKVPRKSTAVAAAPVGEHGIASDETSAPLTHPLSAGFGDQLHEIVMLSRAFDRQLGKALAVNPTDLAAMEHLMLTGSLTPSELARRLDISTAATTLAVDRLVALGHVERRPHAHDRRKVDVVPVPASVEKAFDELLPVIGGVAAMQAAMSLADRVVVQNFLDGVIAVYHRAIDPVVSPSMAVEQHWSR
ncbi:MAG: MarR family winged helix-turn-helix transcriptional regulator [Cryobacterium sp.]